LTLSFDGSGAHLDVTDVGLNLSLQLAAGSYQVAQPYLVVNDFSRAARCPSTSSATALRDSHLDLNNPSGR
jgi:hypothetical protein